MCAYCPSLQFKFSLGNGNEYSVLACIHKQIIIREYHLQSALDAIDQSELLGICYAVKCKMNMNIVLYCMSKKS